MGAGLVAALLALGSLALVASPVQAQSTPTVTGVAVTSSAGSDSTYAYGDTIEVTVTFSEAVTVTGAPRLRIDMDPAHWGTKWARYSRGSGTAQLVFSYAVVWPNISTQGIAVLANTLALNGGAIRASDDSANANLAHTGLAHDSAHKVDWRMTQASTPSATSPTVTGVAVTSSAGSDSIYALGDTIEVTVTFSEAVTVTGAPQLLIDMDPAHWGTKWARYSRGSGGTTLVFAHTVVRPNISTQGIAVLANRLTLNGGTIRASDDSADASLAHTGLAHDPAHKVNWRLTATSPTVTGVAVTSSAGSDSIYGTGEVIDVTVTFSEAVTVTGFPGLRIDMDPANWWGIKWAPYSRGSGTAQLVFSYTVVSPNVSTQGIAVLANTLAFNGGTIRASDDSAHASLVHTGLAHDSAHRVDWKLAQDSTPPSATSPTVTGVAVTSSAGSDSTYALGEAIEVTVTFSEAVTVTGAPRLLIDMDPAHWGTKSAAYSRGSGTAQLVFAHTVVWPNISTQGIAVLANTLALNGGTITAADDSANAILTHTGLGHNSAHQVNWQLTQ